MNQMAQTLKSDVVSMLKKELTYNCSVWPYMDQVVLEISDNDFEKHMGSLIHQIQTILDRHVPVRKENLSIIIRNKERLMDNVIKIWMSI